MSFEIHHERPLGGDYFTRTPSGYSVVARVSCPHGLRPEQAALSLTVPAYGKIAPMLLAHFDGSGMGPAVISDIEEWIYVSVEARQEDNSFDAIKRYLALLEECLAALAGDKDLFDVMSKVTDWSSELTPRER